MRRPLRNLMFGLAAVCVLIPTGAMADVALYAGAGPRFSNGETEAVGSLRASFGIAAMLSLSVEIDGYLGGGGNGQVSAVDFAGAHGGLVLQLPVPLPIKPELAATAGWVNLVPERHGVDQNVAVIGAEVALVGSLGPAKLRAAYAWPLWSEDASLSELALESQLMFSVGVGF